MRTSPRPIYRLVVAASLGIVLGALSPHGAAEAGYIYTDLGTLGGTTSAAMGISNSGQIVGSSVTAGGATDAFLYANGKMTDLGTLGGPYGEASRINASGQIAGDSYTGTSGATDHAFLYANGKMTDLGTLGGPTSIAFSINDSGQVVGRANLADNSTHAFLYQNGKMNDLGTLGGNFSTAIGINNSGVIVGRASLANNAQHAYSYSGGKMTDLGTLGGAASSAIGINSQGDIVGYATTSGNQNHAFLYQNGKMTDLGDLGGLFSSASAINDSGQIVGTPVYAGRPAPRLPGFRRPDGQPQQPGHRRQRLHVRVRRRYQQLRPDCGLWARYPRQSEGLPADARIRARARRRDAHAAGSWRRLAGASPATARLVRRPLSPTSRQPARPFPSSPPARRGPGGEIRHRPPPARPPLSTPKPSRLRPSG